ncbi:acetyl-CoA carboxylase biotin carboxyl carrier protein [Kitasatospora sp. NPDC052896]|uniref:acetyl-CoA carboxylase biotin carboxyl carrier protein n=1 Tax=Kitasatospora sp. NPDC052896 TaxID=3364061 RepID=UPI0037CB1962
MTLNNTEKKTNDKQVPARHSRRFVIAAGPVPAGRANLESVCRSVTELARSTPTPPSRIRLRHGSTTVEVMWAEPAATAPPAAPADGAAGAAAGAEPDLGLAHVRAPMVGTFYHAREPEAPPLVAVGDLIRVGQPVGILEVMKMMSTIEADTAGRVVEILVPNAQPVEFQQRLIAVEPVVPGEPEE